MTALTPFLPPQDEYRRVVDLATRLASTAFVPKGLRGDEPAVLAAMLVGRELGIGALEALRSVHVIDGRPTESAELLHALVLRAGHDLYVAESTGDRCVVRYRRKGWPDNRPDAEVAWTIDDARAAGLTGKDNWKKYPRAMLRSRAVSEAVRQGFPDVVKGAGYVAEELDGPDEVVAEQVAGTVTVEEVARVEPAPPPQTVDEDEDEADARRSLYERARAAYKVVQASEPDVATIAWQALTSGLKGESAPDVFRTADLLVLEQRVEDLEACAADDGEPDHGTTADPDPEPDTDDGGDVVDAEVVEDEPAPATADAEPAPGVPPDERPSHTGDELDEVEADARVADVERAYPSLMVVHVVRLLSGDAVEVDNDGERLQLDVGHLTHADRVALVDRLEDVHYAGKRRRTVDRQLRSTPERPVSSQDARDADEGGDAPAAPATPAVHAFAQPDGMDGAEFARRVGAWRRYEAARSRLTDGQQIAATQLQAKHVGSSPDGVLFVPLASVEQLASAVEQLVEPSR